MYNMEGYEEQGGAEELCALVNDDIAAEAKGSRTGRVSSPQHGCNSVATAAAGLVKPEPKVWTSFNSFEALPMTESDDQEWPDVIEAAAPIKKVKMERWKQPEKAAKNKKVRWQEDASDNSMEDILALLCEHEEGGGREYIMSVTEDGYTWRKEEAAVDSGSVDCVTSRDRFPHLQVKETPESTRGDSWTCAGGKKITKEGEMSIDWMTSAGQSHKINMKVGKVHRTLISADRLLDKGNDVILSMKDPRIMTRHGKKIPLRRKNGMFILDMWVKVPFTGQGKK